MVQASIFGYDEAAAFLAKAIISAQSLSNVGDLFPALQASVRKSAINSEFLAKPPTCPQCCLAFSMHASRSFASKSCFTTSLISDFHITQRWLQKLSAGIVA